MKVKMNPIVKKDLRVAARSMRLSWGLFAYEAVLTLAFLLALVVIKNDSGSIYSSGNIYSYLVYLFPVIAIVQVCIVALITPIITASSISGEKERQTFDIMLTTCMSPFSIVLGKVASAVLRILFYVMASLPIMALSFVVGGLKWSTLFLYLITIIMLAVFCGSIGIMSSAFCRKSIAAVIVSFIFYFVIFGLSFLPMLLRLIFGRDSVGESLLLLLGNPIVFFEEFFMILMTGESLLSDTPFGRTEVGLLTYGLTHGQIWIYVSATCILLLSVVFMLVAAWKVNPMNSLGKARKKKKEGN